MREADKFVIGLSGAGAREAAIVERYAEDPRVVGLCVFPGNGGMHLAIPPKRQGNLELTTFPKIGVTQVSEIVSAAQAYSQLHTGSQVLIDACQDDATASGLVDEAKSRGVLAFGPTKAAAETEWSKVYAKRLMGELGISTAPFWVFDREPRIEELPSDKPLFVKVDGLAAGKGSRGAKNREEALKVWADLRQEFPKASGQVIFEEWIMNEDGSPGEEFSYFVLVNGRKWRPLFTAQDYKRANIFDEGGNTGSMGANSPTLLLDEDDHQRIGSEIIDPWVNGLVDRGRPYTGVSYLGGITTRRNGRKKFDVLEWNSRLGDPEAQVGLRRINKCSWLDVALAVATDDERAFDSLDLTSDGKFSVGLTIASKGYPGDYDNVKGRKVHNVEKALRMVREGIYSGMVYSAGLRKGNDGYYANGGRLITVVGDGENILEAAVNATALASLIRVEGNNGFFRSDIAHRDIERYLQSLRS